MVIFPAKPVGSEDRQPFHTSHPNLIFQAFPFISGNVVCSIRRETFFSKQMVAYALHEIKDDCPQRNRYDHTDEAEEATEQKDGEQYPETTESGRIAEDARAQDIAVELLQNEDENQEVQALHRARQ